MSSNGLSLFFTVAVLALLASRRAAVPGAALAMAAILLGSMGRDGLRVAWRAVLVTVPLVAWMSIVWVGVVGRVPDPTLFFDTAGIQSAWLAVLAVGLRLLLLALIAFGAAAQAQRITPSFAFSLSLPRSAKVVLLAVGSLAESLREGLLRAHTALVAANLLSSRRSLLNARNGWLLLRTAWVSGIGIATERLDTKWEIEDLPGSAPLEGGTRKALTRVDLTWLTVALATVALEHLWRG